MTTTYYNPEDKVNKDGIRVESSWPKEVQQIQRKMLLDRGYLPVIEQGRNIQSALEVSSSEMSRGSDEGGNPVYIRNWTTRRVKAHLAMDKVARYLQEKGLFEDFMKKVYSDAALTDWWLNKRTYVKGEKKHKALCDRLGLPESMMEDMAVKCREIRKEM